jgi:hypothetical protein
VCLKHCPTILSTPALSRELGLPLSLYIAAARIGLAEELKQCLYKVAWIDEAMPNKRFRYLHLSPSEGEWKECCTYNTPSSPLLFLPTPHAHLFCPSLSQAHHTVHS